MKNIVNRRQFFSGTLCTTIVTTGAILSKSILAETKIDRNKGTTIKYSLNAYSFNEPLRSGEMTLFDVIDYCASLDLSGLDATGYYFPGYPNAPEDKYLYSLKRKAFLNGITINGTGVKNDFAVPEYDLRKKDIQMVKNWIEVAEKLGASVIRIFSGSKIPEGYTFDQVLEWMIPDIKTCVEHGKNHGVIVGLQNHNDFAKTAAETIKIVESVNSEWLGVILDTGSLRQLDPYEEISQLLPYAVSWQLKENVWYGKKEMPVDINKIKEIIDLGGYRGFLPLETLGSGDPKVKIENLLAQMREHIRGT
ncbi:sugar phosphate isomerase/epimerase [candidate division KSB1 bacterium]|nr:sugar phosphate isomerase/epimerase [candidate division KSB1 bacterium]